MHRIIEHCIEHRREIAGRGVDHLQYLGRRCLLLQRLALFGEQPGILHCDHRLIGEGADKVYLSVGEWLHPLAGQYDDADWFTFTQQRHSKRCTLLTQSDGYVGITWNGSHVVNVDGPAFGDGPMYRLRRPRAKGERYYFPKVSLVFRWKAKIHRQAEPITLAPDDHGMISKAKFCRRLSYRGEHGLQINVERLITFNRSLVAVWYSSDS